MSGRTADDALAESRSLVGGMGAAGAGGPSAPRDPFGLGPPGSRDSRGPSSTGRPVGTCAIGAGVIGTDSRGPGKAAPDAFVVSDGPAGMGIAAA